MAPDVSSAIYTPRNLMDCAKNVKQVGSVMYGLAKIAKSSQPARLLLGDKGNIG